MARKALGRGLKSLINDYDRKEIYQVDLKKIKPNPFQPRRDFDEDTLKELAESIEKNGVLQPVLLRRNGDDYEIIAGERRCRASRMAGLKDVPAVVRDIDDSHMLQIAIIENVQRSNLNPVEEAEGYRELMEKFDMTHKAIGETVGKSRAHISNLIRILELSSAILRKIQSGVLSVGHGKVLLSVKSKNRRKYLADYTVKHNLSVRDLEALALASPGKKQGKKQAKDKHIKDLEERMSRILDREVSVRYSKGKGSIRIAFYSDDDFNELLDNLNINIEE